MTAFSSSEQEFYARRLKLNNKLQALITVRELVEQGVLLRGDGYWEWNVAEEKAVISALAEDGDIKRQEN